MRQGASIVDTQRNQRIDEILGVSGRAAEKGLRVKDLDGKIADVMANVVEKVYGDLTARSGSVTLEADVINANAVANTIADVTGLSFPVTSGETYAFRALILFAAAATTTGGRIAVNGPAAPMLLAYRSIWPLSGGTEQFNAGLNGYDLPAAAAASSAATAANVAIIEGFIRPSVDGTVTLRFASEVAGSAITIKKGSVLEWSSTP